MKLIKSRISLLPTVTIWISVLFAWLWIRHTSWLLNASYFYWLAAPALIYLLSTGKLNGTVQILTTPRKSFIRWLGLIVLTELLCFFIFHGMQYATPLQAHAISYQALLRHSALLPWLLIGLYLAYYARRLQQNTGRVQTSAIFKPRFGTTSTNTLGVIINAITRMSVQVSLLFFGLFFILLATALYSQFSHQPAHITLSFLPLLLLFALLILLSRKSINTLWLWGCKTPNRFLVSFLILCAIIATLLIAVAHLPVLPLTLPFSWFTANGHTLHTFFWLLWWLFLTPLLTYFFLSISCGYKIWQVVLALLILPILYSVLPWQLHLSTMNSLVLAIISCLLIVYLLIKDKITRLCIELGFIPTEKDLIRSRKRQLTKVYTGLKQQFLVCLILAVSFNVYGMTIIFLVAPIILAPLWLLLFSLGD